MVYGGHMVTAQQNKEGGDAALHNPELSLSLEERPSAPSQSAEQY